MTCQIVVIFSFFKKRLSVFSVQCHMQAVGPTLRRDSVFVGTSRQAAVVRVQTRHVTCPVAARCRTLALLLLPPGRVWKRTESENMREVVLSVDCFLATKDQTWANSGPHTAARLGLVACFWLSETDLSDLFSESNRSDVAVPVDWRHKRSITGLYSEWGR